MRSLLLLACCTTLLAGCATSAELPAATAGPLDSTFRATGLPAGRVKFKGPVVIQLGGSNNTASASAIGKAKGPTATAPAAVATDASTTKKGGTPWWVFGLVGVLSIAGWQCFVRKINPLNWLPWRSTS